MKRIVTIILAALMSFALSGCNNMDVSIIKDARYDISEEQLSTYKAYAETAIKSETYSSSELIKSVYVYTSEDIKNFIESNSEKLKLLNISNAGAIVVINTTRNNNKIYLVNKNVADATIPLIENNIIDLADYEGYERDLLRLNNTINVAKHGSNDKILFSGPIIAETVMEDPVGELAELMDKLKITDEESEDAVRWKIAHLEVDLENYEKENAKLLEPFADKITLFRSTENYKDSIEWFVLQNESSYIKKIAEYEYLIDQTKRHLNIYESFLNDETAVSDKNEIYRRLKEAYEYDIMLNERRSNYLNKIAEFTIKAHQYEEAALEQYPLISADLEALQNQFGNNYKNTIEYKLILARGFKLGEFEAYAQYESAIRNIESCEYMLSLFDKYHSSNNFRDKDMYNELLTLYKQYITENDSITTEYASTIQKYDNYLELKKDDINAYNTALDAIKANYNDNGWEKDNEYLKLLIKNEDILSSINEYEEKLAEHKAEFDLSEENYKSDIENVKAIAEAGKQVDIFNSDKNKVYTALEKILTDFKNLDSEEINKKPKDLPEFRLSGKFEGWVVAETEYIDYLNSIRKIDTPSYSDGSGSGKTCAKPGCSNKAVTSGDSVYCATHSNRCLNCGCYIDGDAMYCMDCIFEALS